jgi:uroporphyrinogen-III synthase
MAAPSFDGRRVLVLESRRARELASLVISHGGEPVSAPSMREVPLESNTAAIEFADALERGEFDLVVLLTGVGTRALVTVVEHVRGSRDGFIEALRRSRIVCRGPKPVAVLRELDVPIWLTAPEPNTWRELLAALDGRGSELRWNGLRVAVQEYGVSNPDLLDGLAERGAVVTRVPVYQWALPEDLEPLRAACRRLAEGTIDVVLFTTATQVVHLMTVAEDMNLRPAVVDGLRRTIVASIGPTTSEELRERGIRPDLEPSHPKMGFLVREAAERTADLIQTKRPSR